jgi:hypothetical protein
MINKEIEMSRIDTAFSDTDWFFLTVTDAKNVRLA